MPAKAKTVATKKSAPKKTNSKKEPNSSKKKSNTRQPTPKRKSATTPVRPADPERFLNVHRLFSGVNTNMNADRTGSPKKTTIGGTQRVRVSSQALKHAARAAVEYGVTRKTAMRSRLHAAVIAQYAIEHLGVTASPEETLDAAVATLSVLYAGTKKRAAPPTPKNNGNPAARWRNEPSLFLDTQDQRRIAELMVANDLDAEGIDLGDFDFLKVSSDVSVAAFGRMFANSKPLSLRSALQVGHAFGTSVSTPTFDFATTTDDLVGKDWQQAHMRTAQLESAVLYNHFNVNREVWAQNLGFEAPPQGEADILVDALLRCYPVGGASATAPVAPPLLLVAHLGTTPQSHAHAFLEPVAEPSVQLSAQRLLESVAAASAFDPSAFSETVIAASFPNAKSLVVEHVPSARFVPLDELRAFASKWLTASTTPLSARAPKTRRGK